MFNLFLGDPNRYYQEEPRPGIVKKLFEYTFTTMLWLSLGGLVLIPAGLMIGPIVTGIGKLLLAAGLAGLVLLRGFDEWFKESLKF